MKKIISIISIIIVFLITYFLQVNFFNWFNIAGIKPNMFIVLMVFIGAYLNKYYGIAIGAALGLLLDFFLGKIIGLNALVLGIAGLLGGLLTRSFSKESKMTMIILSIIVTFICELISYMYQIILFGMQLQILNFIKIILIEILYNAVLLIIFYPLLQKAGNKLEKTFTQDKILTRYY